MLTQTSNLFGEVSPADFDANIALRASKLTLNRAAKVIEHWRDMASNPRYEGGDWLSGDCLNPLANREHDALWEQGDGAEVAGIVRHLLQGSHELARLAIDDSIRRYINQDILSIARSVVEQEIAKTFPVREVVMLPIAQTKALHEMNKQEWQHHAITEQISRANKLIAEYPNPANSNRPANYRTYDKTKEDYAAEKFIALAEEALVEIQQSGEISAQTREALKQRIPIDIMLDSNREHYICCALRANNIFPTEVLTEFPNLARKYETFHTLDLVNATSGCTIINAPIIGKVTDLTCDYLVQDIGKGKRVYHDIKHLNLAPDNFPKKGDRLEIKNISEKTIVINLTKKSLEQSGHGQTR